MLRYNRLTALAFRLHIVNRMKVYRLENAQGIGPYHAMLFQWDKWTNRNHGTIPEAPGPCEDGIGIALNEYKSFKFGFSSLTQLHQWFNDYELEKLAELGFYLGVYEIDANCVRSGKKQIAYRSEFAVLLKQIPLLDYFCSEDRIAG